MVPSEKRSSERTHPDSKSCLTRGIFPGVLTEQHPAGEIRGAHAELCQENALLASSPLKAGWCTNSNPMGSSIFVQTWVEAKASSMGLRKVAPEAGTGTWTLNQTESGSSSYFLPFPAAVLGQVAPLF